MRARPREREGKAKGEGEVEGEGEGEGKAKAEGKAKGRARARARVRARAWTKGTFFCEYLTFFLGRCVRSTGTDPSHPPFFFCRCLPNNHHVLA